MGAPTSRRPYVVTILPDQATRIATVAVMTGAAIGLSQSGSTLTIYTEDEKIVIDAQGEPIHPQKEHLFAQESDHVREL